MGTRLNATGIPQQVYDPLEWGSDRQTTFHQRVGIQESKTFVNEPNQASDREDEMSGSEEKTANKAINNSRNGTLTELRTSG